MHNNLQNELLQIINKVDTDDNLLQRFKDRIKEGYFSIQENPESHFCVHFVPCCLKDSTILIGYHKKCNLWLVNGGHIDKGETIYEALNREIKEEFGIEPHLLDIMGPELISITNTVSTGKRKCKLHFDIWFAININKETFRPEEANLYDEFLEMKWVNCDEAKKLITDINTLNTVNHVSKKYFLKKY